MKILFVARRKNGKYAPFITEQVEALKENGIDGVFFPITQKGVLGYICKFPLFLRVLGVEKPDIVHAHYGLCGLFANLQRRVPVVTSFHGSDINNPRVRPLSKLAMRRSSFSIFVSEGIMGIARPKNDYAVIPCGINLKDYPVLAKSSARMVMGLEPQKKYILFAGSFDNRIKDAPLAQEVSRHIPDAELIELKGYSRMQVATLMQAVDVFLMTSFSEGSPQVIKEAMASGCPIVSVNVGDVKTRIEGVTASYVSQYRSVEELVELLNLALQFDGKTNGRERIVADGLDNDTIARRLSEIYNFVLGRGEIFNKD